MDVLLIIVSIVAFITVGFLLVSFFWALWRGSRSQVEPTEEESRPWWGIWPRF